ncbi:sigma-54-dependent Fis family transcriptional regulator [Ancylomarina salipaludis]|uniref:Sigma-54-dependent Fis family transcriptional regulator n=1 Tax=Ancylomarina salipaludis TaxID=2501299 RepID=A0A4Q1JQD5_9BACT|nr:sigma-54 dependent transcriptional regulator [Ancylomarina salipaludis]RXQ96617.1 sigma-54-dependent Fis family transcriptional regulator [Ancylomarina salipaludis]
MSKILIVDDERSIRNTLKDILSYENYQVSLAENGMEAIKMVSDNEFDVILCDIKMPEMDGIEVLEKLQEIAFDVPVIMISGHGNIDTAVEAIKKGAFDFIEKPLDLNRILITIKNALDKAVLLTETKVLKRKVSKKYDMIGESKAIMELNEMIEKVAPTDARVLITGPNGTGKELVAHRIHEKSNRAKNPFVEVNCAAIPSELIESELFGHEKGSFTSAHKQRKGKFELADGGTLFLDEIGDMSLSAQAKVLRALQENKITRVGGDKEIKVNVRVIAATNKNLSDEIGLGKFREDLYHRLSVILIKVPALNERLEDIPLLAQHFIDLICSEMGLPPKSIAEDAVSELLKFDYTGNIREFRNIIERLIILGGKEITLQDIKLYAGANQN